MDDVCEVVMIVDDYFEFGLVVVVMDWCVECCVELVYDFGIQWFVGIVDYVQLVFQLCGCFVVGCYQYLVCGW